MLRVIDKCKMLRVIDKCKKCGKHIQTRSYVDDSNGFYQFEFSYCPRCIKLGDQFTIEATAVTVWREENGGNT